MANRSQTGIALALFLTALVAAHDERAGAVTSTPTATATATTPTPQPDGAGCTSGSECSSTFCVDGVCCNTPCNQPLDTCSAVPGTCVQAPAPPVSRRGLFAGLALLRWAALAAL
jgi:hypothetical protein